MSALASIRIASRQLAVALVTNLARYDEHSDRADPASVIGGAASVVARRLTVATQNAPFNWWVVWLLGSTNRAFQLNFGSGGSAPVRIPSATLLRAVR